MTKTINLECMNLQEISETEMQAINGGGLLNGFLNGLLAGVGGTATTLTSGISGILNFVNTGSLSGAVSDTVSTATSAVNGVVNTISAGIAGLFNGLL